MRQPNDRAESGFGLVQILVAMMLFGVIMMSAAPALIGSLKQLGRTVAMTAATEFADEQIALARSYSYNCSSFGTYLTTYDNFRTSGTNDPRKNEYLLRVTAWQNSARIDPANLTATCDDNSVSRLPVVLKVEVFHDTGTVADPVVELTSLLAIPGVE